jgi:hypothetical protein
LNRAERDMDLKTEVQVQEGFTVHYNKEEFAPGKPFYCDPLEAKRLKAAGVVTIVNQVPAQQTTLYTEGSLVLAISGLDPDKSNKDIWTRSGMPKAKALSAVTGDPVTAEERNIAYAFYLEMQHGENNK